VRLAVEARYVKFMLGDDNVAVIIKKPIVVNTGCGVRHQITWRSNFLLRGGVKLFPADQIVEIGESVYHAVALRKLGYATIALVDSEGRITYSNVDEKGNVLPHVVKRYEWRKLDKPILVADGYLTFNVEGSEAKLVNDDPTHILFIFEHDVNSRVYDADIKILPQTLALFNESTACKTKAVALAVAIAEIGKTFTVCYNVAPYRHGDFEPYYRCYLMRATIPPQQEFIAGTPNPDQLSLQPDEIL